MMEKQEHIAEALALAERLVRRLTPIGPGYSRAHGEAVELCGLLRDMLFTEQLNEEVTA